MATGIDVFNLIYTVIYGKSTSVHVMREVMVIMKPVLGQLNCSNTSSPQHYYSNHAYGLTPKYKQWVFMINQYQH